MKNMLAFALCAFGFVAGCAPISFSNPEPPLGYTLTCKYNAGPKAGQIEHQPRGVPVPVGMPCSDRSGSTGTGYRPL